MIKHTQTISRQQLMNCLSVFDYFMGLALQGLRFLLIFVKIPLIFVFFNEISIAFCCNFIFIEILCERGTVRITKCMSLFIFYTL